MAIISECQRCLMRVVAQPDGTCPSCGNHISDASDESIDTTEVCRPSPNIETLAPDQPPIIDCATIASLQFRLLQNLDAEEYLEPGTNRSNLVATQLANEINNLAPIRPTACSNLWASLGACSLLLIVQILTLINLRPLSIGAIGPKNTATYTFVLSSLTTLLVGSLILNSVHGRDSRRVVAFRPPGGFHMLVVLLLVLPTMIVVDSVVSF